MKHLFKSLLSVCTFLVAVACNGQGTQPKDNPVVADTIKFGTQIQQFLGDSLVKILQGGEVIEAYRFKKDSLDENTLQDNTAGLNVQGFKILKKKSQITPAQADTLKTLLRNDKSYVASEYLPKCGFNPDLGFKIQKGNDIVYVLLATNGCSLFRFYAGNTKKTRDIYPSINKYYALARAVFPRDYPERNAPIVRDVVAPVVTDTTRQQPPQTDSLSQRAKASNLEHKIVKGETLKSIAKKYEIKEEDIKKLNPTIKSDKDLKEGATLVLKKPEVKTSMIHLVKEGETLKSIAEKYKLTEDNLKKLNPKFKTAPIKAGDELKIK